jgi:hypothetical protein
MADGSISSLAETNQNDAIPAGVRWGMPSVADLICVAILGVLVFTPLSVKLLGDAGIGWHIRTGQQILATHSIPRVDSFSSTMNGQPWFAWEWLYDVIAGRLETIAGLNGLTWFTAVVIAVTFGWMFRLLILRRTNLLFALGLVLLAVSASTIHFLTRPHVLSWWFTLAFFWILHSTELDEDSTPSSRKSWILPVLMVLWVNVHGGFIVGFALLGAFWLASIWTWFKAATKRPDTSLQKAAAAKRVLELTLIALASGLASLINPYGWKLHAHVYAYLSNRFLMDHIEEFQPPNFHGLAQKCFLLLLMSCLAVLLTRRRQLRTSGGFVVLFAVYAGLYASRNIPIASILLALVAGPSLPAIPSIDRFSKKMTAIESSLRGHLWPALAILVTFFIALAGGRIGSHQVMDAHFDAKRMPVGAVNFIESSGVHGPILSPDTWGGYLIYRLYPKTLVVLDDRHDLYGEEFLKSYLNMVHVQEGWDTFLSQNKPQCVVLPRNSALATVLLKSIGWKQIYSDDVSVVFAAR